MKKALATLLMAASALGARAGTTDGETTAIPHLTIDDSAATSPWTHLRLNNDPMNFQFAIVSDRTGGVRPGIFEDAVRKLNLLQPEFVMSVGDMIMGYSRNRDEINQQWDEFEGFVNSLKMPYFYVPGNHDMTNDVEKEIWKERFGRAYYHFVYGNVLFLCLNSEDPVQALGKEQVDYFAKALEENKNVRWTLVFLHRPLWIGSDAGQPKNLEESHGENYEQSGWNRFESLLQGRRYTVYAGHLHRYTKHDRHDEKYIVLGSTGGGSQLRGATPYGEFDHVAWITMTNEGPVMANLELSGIRDENVVTTGILRLVSPLLRQGVLTRPVVTDPLPFAAAPTQIRLTNDADIPVKLTIRIEPRGTVRVEPATIERTVPPNSVEFADVTVKDDGRTTDEALLAQPLHLSWHGEYDSPEHGKLAVDGSRSIMLDPRRVAAERTSAVTLDGDLREWGTLPVDVRQPAEVSGTKAWTGPKDARFRFAVERDDQFVYVAVRVEDNEFSQASAKAPREGDSVEISLDPQPEVEDPGTTFVVSDAKRLKKDPRRPGRRFAPGLVLKAVLAPEAGADMLTTGVQGASRRIAHGYTAEAAFPIAAIRQEQGDDWESFRVNVVVHDRDAAPGAAGNRSSLFWRPEWTGPTAYPNAGTFVRQAPGTAGGR